jgi:hypothetical protein
MISGLAFLPLFHQKKYLYETDFELKTLKINVKETKLI